jgi:hypothetical protein
MRQVHVWVCLAAALSLATVRAAGNLLANGSFEQAVDGAPAEWHVDAGRAGAVITVADGLARSGAAVLRIVNPTAEAPHVYGSVIQTVKVKADTPYTLSCYVQTRQGGKAWIGGGADWQYRFALPEVAADWQRVVGNFTTAAGEERFTVRLLTESPTNGLWVDDVQLEEGRVATDFVYEAPLALGESRLTVTPLTVGPNLVPNPSFEVVDGVRPKEWMWDPRNTDARLEIEKTQARLGSVALRFTNGTPFGAHVYGWFGVVGGIPVKPGTAYTLSAYTRSDSYTVAWFGGGAGWKLRLRLPNTHGQWELISRVFTTGDDETVFPLMVVTESPTPGFWLDGLALREGIAALPADVEPEAPRDAVRIGAELPGPVPYRGGLVETRWAAALYPPGEWAFTSGIFKAAGVVSLAVATGEAAEVEVVVVDDAGQELTRASAACPVGSPLASLALSARLDAPAAGRVVLTARLRRGATLLAESRQPVTLVTPTRIEARLAEVEAERERLRALTTELEQRGVGAYARLTLTVLENFVPWARQDVVRDRADRAWHAAETMLTMVRRATTEAEAVGTGQAPGLIVPRYETSPLEIQGPAFVGTRVAPDGGRGRGPVFFTGYGHFSQVRQDIEKFPAYGCNLCQIEFGPKSVLVAEDRVDEGAIRDFLAVCDRAAKAGVSVNLLLSPHYFPQWALDKWPQLTECRGGFFGYCVHAPEARQVLERFLRATMPLIKDHPALHSLCLSNEPLSTDVSQCRHVAEAWPRWLTEKHGTVDVLNRRWGSTYASFADVPVPKPFAPGALSVDFVRFNQEQFAGFHQWMADVIHEMAPRVPVHAKIMMGAHFGRQEDGIWSVCPELFGDLSQIHGNDCYCMLAGPGEWANGWQRQQMAYDFQRSMGDKPVFNSENHVITDRDHSAIPADHLYSALWQGALHGQSATTIWVWQRTFDHLSDVEGSVIQRPDAAEAIGRCALDLQRLADEMTALQRQPPQVVLYWSQSSVIQGDKHDLALSHGYRQANFLGVPLGFVTDRQLERYGNGGVAPHALAQGAAKVLLVPEAGFVSEAALAGLAKATAAGVRLVRAGPCFGADEYGSARATAPTLGEELAGYSARDRGTFNSFCTAAAAWGLSPALTVTEADGQPAYGVEIRSAMAPGERLVAALCNHTREPRTIVLRRGNVPVASTNLQSGRPQEPALTLPVLQPMLLQAR